MRGHLTLHLTTSSGELVAVRDAWNSVMQGGAELLAELFRGAGGPINRMGVGTSDTPESDAFATGALTTEELEGATEVELTSEEFSVVTDETHRLVRVRLHATLPETHAVGTIREAGLIARTDDDNGTLYNRVTFAPVTKSDDHELTMFWEVSFPYGDLQWMQ